MLDEAQKQVGRRNFLKAAAAAPALGALGWSAIAGGRPLGVGIVGVGGQGGVLLEQTNSGLMQFVAVCDIFEPNRRKAVDKCRRLHGCEPYEYDDYRKMLERDDIDAVLIATPLWLHAPMAIDALKAGKHVFSEKTMAYSVADGQAMIAAAQSAGRVLQIGHQRRYNDLYRQAVQMVTSGLIGDVRHIRALWHRNGDWRRKVPDTPFDPRPWGYADMEHLINWRLYRKHSQGLMTELGSHQVDVANWITGAHPSAVVASGGIHHYPDGREVNDHVYAIFEYPGGLTLTYSSIQTNQFDQYYEAIMGTRGTILLQGEGEAFLFAEADRASKATEVTVTSTAGGTPVLEASASRAADASAGSATTQAAVASSLVPYHNELEAFAYSVRTGEPPRCGGAEALAAARAVLAANEAMQTRSRVELATPA